ncbi:DUF4386 domain-containing protein [Halobacillus trueperi]|uniref:DUF4386 domain-containing protein n=1 Tax=Halobacillus trueperi TaxID=156205 RepID=A0A3D8VI59_9BACI|nr:DUF4386 domain-containing protein [Halobacillus trueperi]RDY69067.1 DUF4386 domain-containing protein [Halobacillus trueperi]
MKKLNKSEDFQRKPAIIAGMSLLLMTLAAFFSYGYAHSSLVVYEDAAKTHDLLQSSLSLFHLEIVGWVVIIITDLIVSWAFYKVLKPIHSSYALLAGVLRLFYTIILTTAVFRLWMVSQVIQSDSGAAPQVMANILSFEKIWSMGLIVFGVHLIMVGFLALKADFIPKWISILLMIAGVSYLLIHSMYNGLPQYETLTTTIETVLSLPMMIGELGFGIWLLVKGIKAKPSPRTSYLGAS